MGVWLLSCFSCVWLCGILWTVACQDPLSMGFSRQKYWSGWPCPPPGHQPHTGNRSPSPLSPVLAVGFLTTSATWKDQRCWTLCDKFFFCSCGWYYQTEILFLLPSFQFHTILFSQFMFLLQFSDTLARKTFSTCGGLVAKLCPTLQPACHWSGLPFPSAGNLPDQGIKSRSLAVQVDSLPTEIQGKPLSRNTTVKEGTIQSLSLVWLCDPMDCSMQGFPVHYQQPELTQTHALKSVMPSNHVILCRPLLLLSSIFPQIRVFSSESVLHIR